jgi:hypothetical protein
MMATRLRLRSAVYLVAGGLLAALLVPEPAAAQCVGTTTVQDFGVSMKGCAGVVTFGARACATGWHVCSAQEWVERHGGTVPLYNYWTDDNLRFSTDADGCLVSTSIGTACTHPFRVCTISRGDYDGAYESSSRVYTILTYLADGSITFVTALDRATLAPQTFIGSFSGLSFTGPQVGGPGSLTLTFTSKSTGTDGTETFARIGTQQFFPTDTAFTRSQDPLGNFCNYHSCGLNAGSPNHFFGGCQDDSAGVLCCQ